MAAKKTTARAKKTTTAASKKPAAKKAAAKKAAAKKAAAKKAAAKKAAAKKAPARGAAPKTSAAKKGAARVAGAAGEVGLRVRMHRVGFGDFFLLSVPTRSGTEHVLFDCGVHSGTTGKGDIGSIKDAVDAMQKETGGHLALIVMTHRHADHISGFSRCADQFAQFKVDAVWMPAWEREYDAKAKRFQTALTRIAFGLQQHLELEGAPPDEETREAEDMLYNATGITKTAGVALGAAAKGGSNAKALDLLKNGLGVTPDYYAAGDKPKLPKALADAGLTAKILGPPPVDDAAFMKLMDLQKGVGQYLGADLGGTKGTDLVPFENAWEVGANAYSKEAFEEWSAPDGSAHRALESAIQAAQPAALLTAAKTLDAFLNNQSLVILLEFKGKKLLFVGDAQAGNWEHWLYDDETPTKTPNGTLSANAKTILSEIDFYKVGHHGSTNATPIAAVEAMGDNFTALCSTQEGTYGSASKGTEVPRIPLIDALSKKSALVRSDGLAIEVDGKNIAPVKDAPTSLPKPKGGRFQTGPLWIDYFL